MNYDCEEDGENIQSPLSQLITELPQYVVSRKDFEIIDPIGDGGFGQVFRARNKNTGQMCAFKDVFEKRLYVDQFRKYISEIRIVLGGVW